MRKFVVGFLCIALPWALVFPAHAVHAAATLPASASDPSGHAGARVIHVAPEAYPNLESVLRAQGYQVAGAPTMLAAAQYEALESQRTVGSGLEPSRSDCDEAAPSGDTSLQVAINVMDSLTPRDGGDMRAAVVFVVIGAIVLVVWTLYAVKYVYDAAIGTRPCGRWSDLIFSSSAISAAGGQHARFTGIRYLSGFRDGGTDVGLSVEAGHADILLKDVDSLNLQGAYWLLGPVLRWRMSRASNPNYFQIEFLAGSTEHREMGLLAQAKAALSFGIDSGFRWGVSFGAMNINLNDNNGIINDRDQYHYLFGFDMGYRF